MHYRPMAHFSLTIGFGLESAKLSLRFGRELTGASGCPYIQELPSMRM